MVDPTNLIPCYIVNMLTNKVIKFGVLPEELSESLDASWESTDVRGRSAPYFGYAGNGARSVSFSVTLHSDICKMMKVNIKDVVNNIKKLVYPKYSGSIISPPYCYVKFGDMLSMMAIVNSVSVSWNGTIIGNSKHYSTAEVSFDFSELCKDNIPTASKLAKHTRPSSF